MNQSIKKVSLIGLMLTAIFASCTNDDDRQAHLSVRLTDAPGDYQAVNIDIQDVQVNTGDDDSGWKSLPVKKGIYDLLKLTNGLDTLLGETNLPAGKISQVRLVLGNNNSVRVDGKTESLSTPSAQQSGLKVQVHADLKAGSEYVILLDFDAARSIVSTGNGSFKLKPVIRAIVEEQANEFGAISGTVSPVDANPAIHAIIGTDTVSAMINTGGNFLINGLHGGEYRIVFVPVEGFLQEEILGVDVTAGDTTNVGTVEISHL
jgi:hypothetical protein